MVNARFVKPVDRVLLRHLALQTGALVTMEEAQRAGGFGSAVSEELETLGLSTVPLHRIALPDQFVEHGTRTQLLAACQLDVEGLTSRLVRWWNALKKLPAEDRTLVSRSSHDEHAQ